MVDDTLITHTKIKLSSYNIANLKKLANYLANLPSEKKFSMIHFLHDMESDEDFAAYEAYDENYNCNTIACALAYGPMAGISSLKYPNWYEYANVEFGLERRSIAWDWCFHGQWEYVDNTPQGAAKRINYMLEFGIPSNHENQMYGRIPIQY